MCQFSGSLLIDETLGKALGRESFQSLFEDLGLSMVLYDVTDMFSTIIGGLQISVK